MKLRIDRNKTEYYLFNAFDQMKAYSENGETYGYYGYDDAGQRTYKATLKNFVSRTNALGGKTLEVEKLMLYPNGYININQDGNYTKHYYADAARIASKIGNGFIDTANLYYSSTSSDSVMIAELTELTGDTIESIDNKYDSLWLQIDSGKYEDALYFYHGNNLSSTQLITDYNGAISQAVLYTPFGQIISNYNQTDWQNGIVPEYMFTAAERDQESGMDYMSARYYSSDYNTFISRDKKFEKYFWFTPYSYCLNSPLNVIDPAGEDVYMLFYTKGNDRGDEAFKASAETRKAEIEANKNFNSEKDIVIMMGIKDISDVGSISELAATMCSEKYGQTAEVSVWSHAGPNDGPRGSVETSFFPAGGKKNHMSLEGWGSFNFNWKDGANLNLYGCNTGKETSEDNNTQYVKSFAKKVSALGNMRGVNVWGQSSSAYPSFSTTQRSMTARMAAGNFAGGPTYMVGGNKDESGKTMWFNPFSSYPSANRMNVYNGGKKIRTAFQGF